MNRATKKHPPFWGTGGPVKLQDTAKSPRNGGPAITAAALAFVISLSFSPAASAESGGTLAGEAFTDTSYRVAMPEDWAEKPITYEGWARGADLAVTLDQHLYPAYEPVIREYAKKNGLVIAVNEGTCGISAGMLARKAADIAGFCCPPGLSDRLPGLKYHTLGIASLAIIVHPDNTINGITSGQARSLFMGEYYKWSEISEGGRSGPDIAVRPVGRLHCKTRPGHWRLVLDNEDLFSIRLQEVGTIPDMISLVASNAGSVGYEVLWMCRLYSGQGRVKPLSIDGAAPDDNEALISGRYPFYRTLTISTWEDERLARPEAGKLRDHMVEAAAGLDSAYGIVPASELRRAGWKFEQDELVGQPD